jgi:hypothetical protein
MIPGELRRNEPWQVVCQRSESRVKTNSSAHRHLEYGPSRGRAGAVIPMRRGGPTRGLNALSRGPFPFSLVRSISFLGTMIAPRDRFEGFGLRLPKSRTGCFLSRPWSSPIRDDRITLLLPAKSLPDRQCQGLPSPYPEGGRKLDTPPADLQARPFGRLRMPLWKSSTPSTKPS